MTAKVPVAGQTYTFGVNVVSQGDTDIYQAAPTIAAGDFQRSINGAAFENMDNLPTVTPAGGKRIAIVLSAAETTAAGAGGHIHIVGSDAAGAEWQDISIEVTVFDADVATGDIYGIVSNAGYGNSALGTAIAAIPTMAAPSAADVADAVADEVLSGHVGAGSLAVAITDISSAVAAVPTVGEIDTQLSGTHGAGAWGAAVVGASSVVYTVAVGGSPLAGVYVRMTTDAAGANSVDAGTTTALGQVTLHHDLASGTTVYLWRSLAGYEFADPDVEVIP